MSTQNILPEQITIGVDTEFRQELTLSVQAAVRTGPDSVTVQIYRSPLTPEPDLAALEEHAALQSFRGLGRVW